MIGLSRIGRPGSLPAFRSRCVEPPPIDATSAMKSFALVAVYQSTQSFNAAFVTLAAGPLLGQ